MKDKIILNGQEFSITESKDINNSGSYGEKHAYNHSMRIADYLEGLEKLGTIMHEIIHHFMRFAGADHKFNKEDQEYICDFLGYGFASLMMQNPDLMDLVEK